MRVTHKMISDGVIRNIERNMSRLDKVNNQLASGKKMRVPSDDPMGTVSAMRLRRSLSQTSQYMRNIDQAISWVEATDSALDEAGKVWHRARDLALYAGNRGALPDDAINAIADEVKELLGHLVLLGNATVGDRHVFGGHKTLSAPFALHEEQGFVYAGDNGRNTVEVGPGVVHTYSVPGSQSLSPVMEAIHNLHSAITESGDLDEALSKLDSAYDTLLRQRSELGARANTFELTKDRLQGLELNFSEILGSVEDVDIAGAMMEIKMLEYAQQVSLAVGARIVQTTLVDYLR